MSIGEVERAYIEAEKNVTGEMNNKKIRILLGHLDEFPTFPRDKIPDFGLQDDDPFEPLKSLVKDKKKKSEEPSLFWSIMKPMVWLLMFYATCKLF